MSNSELLRAQNKEYVDLQKLRLSMYFTSVENLKHFPPNQTEDESSSAPPAPHIVDSIKKSKMQNSGKTTTVLQNKSKNRKSGYRTALDSSVSSLDSDQPVESTNKIKPNKRKVETTNEQEKNFKSKKNRVNKSLNLEQVVDEQEEQSFANENDHNETSVNKTEVEKRIEISNCESWAWPYQKAVSKVIESLSAALSVENNSKLKLPESVLADTLRRASELQAKRIVSSGIPELLRHLFYMHDSEMNEQTHSAGFWKGARTDSDFNPPVECPVRLNATKQQHKKYLKLLEKIVDHKEKKQNLTAQLQKAKDLKEFTGLLRETVVKMSEKDLMKSRTLQHLEQVSKDVTELFADLKK